MGDAMGDTGGQVRYRQQWVRCGKPNCQRCLDGPSHGPYWYAVWREGTKTRTRYVGKTLPPGLHEDMYAAEAPSPEISNRAPVPKEAAPTLARAAPGILRIWTLGRFMVERDGVPIPASAWRRRSAPVVLKLLLLAEQHRLPREHLAAHLWPDSDDDARGHLAVAIHALRRALEPATGASARSRYVVQEGHILALRLGPEDWVDYVAFEAALREAETAEDPLPALIRAADLYGGDLFPEESEIWCVAVREALRLRWHGALLALAEALLARRQLDAALAALMRLLAADPANEEAARRIMGLLGRGGRRAEALRLYERLEQTLREEFDAAPATETAALVATLRAGGVPSRPPVSRQGTRAATTQPRQAPPPLIGRQQEVQRVHAALLEARTGQGQVLLLTGDAGSGKSRLAAEAMTMAIGLGFAILSGRAADGEQDLPYAPIIEALRAALTGRPSAAIRRDLAGAEALVGLLPELQAAPVALQAPAPLEDQGAERLRLWTACRALLATLGSRQPILLAIDDLHWSDEASLGLLTFIMRRCRDLRVLLVGSLRLDGERSPALRRLLDDGVHLGHLQQLALPPLQSGEVAEVPGSASRSA